MEKTDTLLQKIQPFFLAKKERLKYEPKHVEKRLCRLFVEETKKFIKSFKAHKISDEGEKPVQPKPRIQLFLSFQKKEKNYKPQHSKGWSPLTIVAFLVILTILVSSLFWYVKS